MDEKLRLQVCDKLKKVENQVFEGRSSVYKFRFSIADDHGSRIIEIVSTDYQNSWIGWTNYECTLSNVKRDSIKDKFGRVAKYFWKMVEPLALGFITSRAIRN